MIKGEFSGGVTLIRDIDLSNFKVVYGDRVYNAVALARAEFPEEKNDAQILVKPKRLIVIVVNEDGNLMCIDDEAWTFQFLPRK